MVTNSQNPFAKNGPATAPTQPVQQTFAPSAPPVDQAPQQSAPTQNFAPSNPAPGAPPMNPQTSAPGGAFAPPTPGGTSGFDWDATDNFAGVSSSGGGGGYIEPGVYLGYCSKVEPKATSKGELMLACFYTIADGPYAGRTTKARNVLFRENTAWVQKQLGEAAGVDMSGAISRGQWRDGILWKLVAVVIREGEPYNGNPQSEIDRINDPSAFGYPTGTHMNALRRD